MPGFEQYTARAYPALHELAQRLLQREATPPCAPHDLLHDAYLRLTSAAPYLSDDAHGYRLYALTMRRLLVEKARWRQRARHGGHLDRVPLSAARQTPSGSSAEAPSLVAEALTALERVHAGQARVLRLCHLEGYTQGEASARLAVSLQTVKRWKRSGQATCAAYLRADGLG
ncbi:MAG: ECF-type sigma factor [Bacteroidota bacterium]